MNCSQPDSYEFNHILTAAPPFFPLQTVASVSEMRRMLEIVDVQRLYVMLQNDHWKDAKQDQPEGVFPIIKEFCDQYLMKDFESLEELIERLEALKAEGGMPVNGFHGFNYEYSKAITQAFVTKTLEDMER